VVGGDLVLGVGENGGQIFLEPARFHRGRGSYEPFTRRKYLNAGGRKGLDKERVDDHRTLQTDFVDLTGGRDYNKHLSQKKLCHHQKLRDTWYTDPEGSELASHIAGKKKKKPPADLNKGWHGPR